jgi:hypothetical protein
MWDQLPGLYHILPLLVYIHLLPVNYYQAGKTGFSVSPSIDMLKVKSPAKKEIILTVWIVIFVTSIRNDEFGIHDDPTQLSHLPYNSKIIS